MADSRLLKIAEMIRRGDRVADIGTDHAYLPVYLISKGISPLVYACDVSDGPLLNAKSNIEKSGVKNIVVKKGNGLSAVSPEDADTFVIAGMGGDLIIKIITAAKWVKNERYEFILQPMTSAEDLRKFLLSEGFNIAEEHAVTAAGRIYTVIKAKYCGIKNECSDFFYYMGKLTDNIGKEELIYIRRKRRVLSELTENIKSVPQKQDTYKRLQEVILKIDDLVAKYGN
jgi:tRNA (adenine22-N1)-methyltransferase